MAVFWHEAPPEGHSSPATQMASLSPQFTEQPPQLPRGVEGGALQALPPEAWSEAAGGPEAVVLGGPVSLEDPPVRLPVVAQPEPTSSTVAKAAATRAAQRSIESVFMFVVIGG